MSDFDNKSRIEKQFEMIGGCFLGSMPHLWIRCLRCEARIHSSSYSSRFHRCNCTNGMVRTPFHGIHTVIDRFKHEHFPRAFIEAPSKRMRPIGQLDGLFSLYQSRDHAKTGLIENIGFLIPFRKDANALSNTCFYVSFLSKSPVGEVDSWWRLKGDTTWASTEPIPRNSDDIPINTEVRRYSGILYQMSKVKYTPIDWAPIEEYIQAFNKPNSIAV